MKSVLFLFFAWMGYTAVAQVTAPENASVKNDVQKASPTVILRGDYYFTKGSYLYYEANYNFNENYSYLTNGYRVYNQVGYEHAATSFWYIGASVKHQFSYAAPNALVAKVNLTHRGKIGSIGFLKELSGEYLHLFKDAVSTARTGNTTEPVNMRGAFAVGLYKIFKVAQRPLIPSFYYKAYLNTNLGETYKNRRFDFIKTRIDLTYGITKNIYAGIFGMLDSEHYYTLGYTSYNSAGDLIADVPDYRMNRINPVVGIALNVVFMQEGFDKDVVPGLPFRKNKY